MKLQWEILLWSGEWIKSGFYQKLYSYTVAGQTI